MLQPIPGVTGCRNIAYRSPVHCRVHIAGHSHTGSIDTSGKIEIKVNLNCDLINVYRLFHYKSQQII